MRPLAAQLEVASSWMGSGHKDMLCPCYSPATGSLGEPVGPVAWPPKSWAHLPMSVSLEGYCGAEGRKLAPCLGHVLPGTPVCPSQQGYSLFYFSSARIHPPTPSVPVATSQAALTAHLASVSPLCSSSCRDGFLSCNHTFFLPVGICLLTLRWWNGAHALPSVLHFASALSPGVPTQPQPQGSLL